MNDLIISSLEPDCLQTWEEYVTSAEVLTSFRQVDQNSGNKYIDATRILRGIIGCSIRVTDFESR